MYSKFALRATLFCLFLCIIAVFAAPVPEPVAEPAGLSEPSGEALEELEDRSDVEKRWMKGKMTYFYPGLGACEKNDNNNSMIVALSTSKYAGGKHCNKYISIKANGKTVKAKVRDMCPGCGEKDIDVSPAVFKKLVPKSQGGLDKGVQKVSWDFV